MACKICGGKGVHEHVYRYSSCGNNYVESKTVDCTCAAGRRRGAKYRKAKTRLSSFLNSGKKVGGRVNR